MNDYLPAWLMALGVMLFATLGWLTQQLADPGFWVGAGSVATVVVLTPMLRSTFGLAGGYLGRVVYAYWYYAQDDFPDYINVTLNLFFTDERGKRWFDIDSQVADMALTSVYLNAYVAYLVRRAFGFTEVGKPLVRFDAPRRKKTRWCNWRHRRYGRMTSFRERRRELEAARKRRYAMVYNPIISLLGQYGTNQRALDHAFGGRYRVEVAVVALTYERGIPYRSQHGRVMVIPQDDLQNLPETCPAVRHTNYRTRFETIKQLAEDYRRCPDRFGHLYVRVPIEPSVTPVQRLQQRWGQSFRRAA